MKFLVIALFLFSSSLYAAINLTPATAKATALISITKNEAVNISKVTAIKFATSPTIAPQDKYIDVCVYSTTGNYRITASSAYNSAFNLRADNIGKVIHYKVRWSDSINADNGKQLAYNLQSPIFNNADTKDEYCNQSIATARLFVAIDAKTWQQAPAGNTYSDTLQILLSAD